LRGYLEVRYEKGKFYVYRQGVLNAYLVDGKVMLANPSEVIANDDEIETRVYADSRVVVTDQAYSKVLSRSRVKVANFFEGKEVLFFPHPIIFYDRANAFFKQTFHLERGGIIVEAFTLGRKGHGEVFKEGKVKVATKVYVEGELKVYDVFRNVDEEYKRTMGKESLLTVYKVDGDVEVERIIVPAEELDKEFKKLESSLGLH